MILNELIKSLEWFRDNSPENWDIRIICEIDGDARDISEIKRYYFADLKFIKIIWK
jgi:hypothetical protein